MNMILLAGHQSPSKQATQIEHGTQAELNFLNGKPCAFTPRRNIKPLTLVTKNNTVKLK